MVAGVYCDFSVCYSLQGMTGLLHGGELTINSYDTIEHFIIMQLNGIEVNNKELLVKWDSSQRSAVSQGNDCLT